jgi:hypothetical protein
MLNEDCESGERGDPVLIVRRTGAKRRHALFWLLVMLFCVGGPFAFLVANLEWPHSRKKKTVTG